MFISSLRNFLNPTSQVKTVHRLFSISELLLRPLDSNRVELVRVSPKLKAWLKDKDEGFADGYKHLLQCIEQQNLPSLMECCDSQLCKNLESLFDSLNAQKKTMRIVNESSEVKLNYFNEKLEIRLPKFLMKRKILMKPYYWLVENSEFIPRPSINFLQDEGCEKIALSVDVQIKTSMKVMIGESQDDDSKEETHLVRFQITKEYTENEMSLSALESLKFLKDGTQLEKCNWMIIDINKSTGF